MKTIESERGEGVQQCKSRFDEDNCDKLEFNECEDDAFSIGLVCGKGHRLAYVGADATSITCAKHTIPIDCEFCPMVMHSCRQIQ